MLIHTDIGQTYMSFRLRGLPPGKAKNELRKHLRLDRLEDFMTRDCDWCEQNKLKTLNNGR